MPEYVPAGVGLEMAADTPTSEPEFCVLPPGRRRTERRKQPAAPAIAITHLHLGTPSGVLTSLASRWAASTGLLSTSRENEYVLRVAFDNAAAQRLLDARPVLPPVLEW